MKSLFNDVKHDMAKEDPDMLAPTIAQLEGMHDLGKIMNYHLPRFLSKIKVCSVCTSSKAASSLFCSSRGNSYFTVLSANDSPNFYGTPCHDSYDHHGASHVLVGLRALPLHLWTFKTVDHLLHPCVSLLKFTITVYIPNHVIHIYLSNFHATPRISTG